jgi:hypothetical protein
MKKLFILFAAASVLAACTTPKPTENSATETTLTTPEPAVGQYTLQSFYIPIPVTDFHEWSSAFPKAVLYTQTNPGPSQEAIEALFEYPNAEIIEFPLVRAGIGESVTIDQTTVYEGPVDADIIDGKVVYATEPIDLGKRISLTIKTVNEDKSVICEIHPLERKLIGMDRDDIGEGLTIEMPKYKTYSVDTKLTILPNTWSMSYGPITEREDGTRMHVLFLFRLLPPR